MNRDEELENIKAAYNRLAMLHTETMAELAETQRMLWARLNFFQTLALWVKHKLKNK